MLCWLAASPLRWQVFVANRVQKIQSFIQDCLRGYVASGDNPADVLSRGMNPKAFSNREEEKTKLWWNGPNWLHTNVPYSNEVKFKPTKKDLPELRRSRKFTGCVSKVHYKIFDEFSNYLKLIRATAWRMRLLWNLHYFGPHLSGPLEVFELEWAFKHLVSLVQKESFLEELKALKANRSISNKSPLSLPYLLF